MKLQPGRIDAYLNNLDPNLAGCLIYGPDAGLVSERAELVISKILGATPDPFLLAEIDPDKLKDEPGLIANEMASISFFSSGRKLIRLRDAGETAAPILKSLLEKHGGSSDAFLLVTSDELGPRSALRKLAETAPNLAAVPCYKDDSVSLGAVVGRKLREQGYAFENGVTDLIAGNCLGDRMILNREIEKLIIYIGEDRKTVTLADVYACVVESSELSMEELCNAVADRDLKKLGIQLKRAYGEGMYPAAILRYVSNYFFKFNEITAGLEQGKNDGQIIEGLKPPVFFKQMPILKRQAIFWAKDVLAKQRLSKATRLLLDAELKTKALGISPEIICSHYLSQIASIR